MSGHQPDARFARLETDPRFRRPKQKNLKVEIDERFRDVLESEEFGGKGKGKGQGSARVDKRGRPLTSSHHADQLKRFYRLRSPSPSGSGSGKENGGFVDYARGDGLLSSSGSEDERSDEESEVEEEELELGKKSRVSRFGVVNDDESESDSESGESHLDVNLSDETNGLESHEEDDEGAVESEDEKEEYAEPTKRIAAVNLDWDNLRATDLFAVFNSFLKAVNKGESSTAGRLVHVKIYPSEFGKSRMEKEEAEGPGGGMFVAKPGDVRGKGKGKSKQGIVIDREEEEEDEDESEDGGGDLNDLSDEDEFSDDGSEADSLDDEDGILDDDGNIGKKKRSGQSREIDGLEIISDVSSDAGSDDINMDQLRQYQLERLRYYYAIATFSTVDAAMMVLAECTGTEFERTANMFDLTYVPEGMEFAEDEIRDEASGEAKGYKGNDFVTDALRHSKVKLTWDQDDPNRIKVTRRNLTREEIEEEDFKAYLASSASESEEDGAIGSTSVSKSSKVVDGKKGKRDSAKERTEKLRALLLTGGEDDGDVWGKAGMSNNHHLGEGPSSKKAANAKSANRDMEITFRPGLSASKSADDENLTTLEKYQLRMKEKKSREKEKAELKRAAKEDDVEPKESAEIDHFFGEDDDSEEDQDIAALPTREEMEEDLQRNRDGDGGGGVEHFSMKDVLKAEKGEGNKRRRKRRGKGKKTGGLDDEKEVELGPTGWKINVKDARFKALHEEPDFAIDPSNPHFTKTKAMKDLLAERSRVRAQQGSRAPVESRKEANQPDANGVGGGGGGDKDLSALVQSVKRKMGEGKNRSRKRRK